MKQNTVTRTVRTIVREGKKRPYWAFGDSTPRLDCLVHQIFQLFVSEERRFNAYNRCVGLEYLAHVRFVHDNCLWAEWRSGAHEVEADAVQQARTLISEDYKLVLDIMQNPHRYAWCREMYAHFKQPVFGLMHEHSLHSQSDWELYKVQNNIVPTLPAHVPLPVLTAVSA